MVLCGKVNKDLVATAEPRGRPRPLACAAWTAACSRPRTPDRPYRYGLRPVWARSSRSIPAPVIDTAWKRAISRWSPPWPRGSDDENATTTSTPTPPPAKLAVALGAKKLILLTDVRGLLRDPEDESTLISAASRLSDVPQLVREGVIQGGMIPKVDCCVEAVRSGVESRQHPGWARHPLHPDRIIIQSGRRYDVPVRKKRGNMTYRRTQGRRNSTYVMNTYGRFPIALDRRRGRHGMGCRGQEVHRPRLRHRRATAWATITRSSVDAITAQAHKLMHVSNLFTTEPMVWAAKKLVEKTHLNGKVFFANSGAEANEGAIKLARKYSFDKYGEGRYKIVTLVNSFHGRTVTTLKATGQDRFHNYFFPFTEGFDYAEANDFDSVQPQSGRYGVRGHARTGAGRGRRATARSGVCQAGRGALPRKGPAAHHRRGADRRRPHGQPVLLPAVRHPSGRRHDGQGAWAAACRSARCWPRKAVRAC